MSTREFDTDDPVLAALSRLPPRDLEAARVEAIRRAALARLAEAGHGRQTRWLDALERFYTTVVEPVVYVGGASTYLVLAFQNTAALFR